MSKVERSSQRMKDQQDEGAAAGARGFKSRRRDEGRKAADSDGEGAEHEMVPVRKSKRPAPLDDGKMFSSRRMRDYADDRSNDSDAENLTTTADEQTKLDTQGQVVSLKPNPRFKNYS